MTRLVNPGPVDRALVTLGAADSMMTSLRSQDLAVYALVAVSFGKRPPCGK
jgi:hypothetical protein